MFDDTSQTTNYGSQWQCLACDSPHTELDLPSLQKHFASQHNVLNLLSSPATQVFVENSYLLIFYQKIHHMAQEQCFLIQIIV